MKNCEGYKKTLVTIFKWNYFKKNQIGIKKFQKIMSWQISITVYYRLWGMWPIILAFFIENTKKNTSSNQTKNGQFDI